MALSDICSDFAVEIERIYNYNQDEFNRECPVPLHLVEEFKYAINFYQAVSPQNGGCRYDPRIIAGIHRIVDACVINRRWFYTIISLKMVDVFVGRCPDSRDTLTDDQMVNWLDVTFNMMPAY